MALTVIEITAPEAGTYAFFARRRKRKSADPTQVATMLKF
jgi:hypothetical protein